MSSRGGLRIGLVCPYSFDAPGGVQNHVLGLAGYLMAHGHDPHILAPGEHVPPGYEGDGDPAGSGAHFTSAGAAVPVRYNGSVARVNFGPLSAARVARWLRHGRFDLVHLHEPVTPSISMLALWAADAPVVATFHTATPRSRSMQLAGGALRSAVEKIDAGIAVSESARHVVVQHLGRDAVVIPNGFRFADFAPPPAEPDGGARVTRWRGGDRPRLTFLGRMDEPRKGLDVLLAALPGIRAEHPGLDVVVAGAGQRALPAGCRAVGVVGDREKAELLAGSDVFVAPHVARESFGIVVLEAMASRTPVVASDLPAFCDLLAAGPTPLGSTFPVGDHAALARTVCRVLGSPDPGQLEAAARASREYDWELVGAAVTEVYRATLALTEPRTGREGRAR